MSEKTKPINKKKALEEKKLAARDAKTAKTLERLREMEEIAQARENLADAEVERTKLKESGLYTNPKFNLTRAANNAIIQERVDEKNQERAKVKAERNALQKERMRELDEYTEANNSLRDARAESTKLKESGLDTNPTFNLERVASNAIKQERIDERNQEKAKVEAERNALQKEGDDYVSRKNQEKEQQQKEEEDMNWTYVDGDKDSANQRFRTIDKTSMEEVEDTKVIEKQFNDGVSTGKTDKEVYESDPGLKDKYSTLGEFRKAAEAFRASQNTTETVTSKKLVPVTTQETITQDREDFEKTNHWSSKFNPVSISRMSRKLKERGADVSPDELEKVFKNMSSEKDAIKWARENGYDFLVGRGSGSGSTTTRGKTDWS